MDKQKDFEKGWEEYKAKKKQMIEEMEKDIAVRMAMAKGVAGSMNNGVEGWLGEYLVKMGWIKPTENAVVWTEKELFARDEKIHKTDREYIKALEECINNRNAKARKETAEKILNELYVQFSADYLVGLRNEYKDWKYADLIKRYAKSVGVEIKE